MKLRPGSVRTRLALWHAGALTLIVCGFSAAVFLIARAQLLRDLDASLARDVATIERTYRQADYDLIEVETRAGVELFEVTRDGRVLYRTAGWSRLELDPAASAGAGPATWRTADGRSYRVATRSWDGLRISAAVDDSATRSALDRLALILALGIPCAALAALGGGLVLAGRVLAPVGAMAKHARRISAESLDDRLPVEDPRDEFGRLASVFNDTLGRIQDAFERQRRFTADASHELRTPLTAMRSVGEVALQRGHGAADYREVIGSMLEEADRLTALVEGLLTLARADSGRIPATRERVDLGALASGVVEHLRVLAEEKGQALTLDCPAGVAARCDPALVRQALVNLLDNAIKYTPAGGAIRVGAALLPSGEAGLQVKDDGPGIAAAHLERIFDRFYRVDPARSKQEGGIGLGLAIARSVALAGGGRIEVESAPGSGSLFRVVLPAA
ncbi:ATP-binding protein [Anaeromyxobacter paludicola]|uniref:histidine kinase n=1 Tax=Anaeromyxobacter paludicola TaxID=2918171 RepID=A0ABN6NFC8_9BACT|nr:ATP-binding protein [Anaeromyxobacter paludicola]BDG10762.1 two-component sensor histidine kinase [Anaeromyxobacter paludicola]